MVGGLCFGAEKYPTKPIQVIVPYAAGGSSDVLARTVEKVWTKYSPQPMLIVNKPGAGGVLGTEYVVRSKPDGYTLLFAYGSGCDLVMPHLQKMPYDPLKDITPVARISIHSVVVSVSGKSQFKSMKDVIDWAQQGEQDHRRRLHRGRRRGHRHEGHLEADRRPDHHRALHRRRRCGHRPGRRPPRDRRRPPLRGAGRTSKSGRFRPVGVALDKRDSTLPNVPTLKEQGIDVATWGSVKGVAVPNGTPPEIVEYLASTLKKVCEDKDFKKTMAQIGQPIDYLNTKDWAAFLQKAYKDYGDLIKELDIKI